MKESKHGVSELAFLFKLLPLMQELETVDKIYRLLLAIATTGDAIGYRRGMLFVVDERDDVIRGRFGVEQPAPGPAQARVKRSFEDRARGVFAFLCRSRGTAARWSRRREQRTRFWQSES
jgi:hypothetical protein